MGEKEKKIKGYIYRITNIVNGKQYIGQTARKDPHHRIKQHFFHSRNSVDLVSFAAQKYGVKSFVWDILICCTTQSDLDFWEKHFIAFYNTLAPVGYNLRIGGKTFCTLSSEARQKISKALKGKPKTKLHRQRMSQIRKGFTSPARRLAWQKRVESYQKKVCAQKIEGGSILTFPSIEAAARVLTCQPSCITRVCRGKQNRTQHNGYKFWFG